MKVVELLSQIQVNLKAPKGQFNKFGNYKYRSCEDIVEAVKPLLNGGILLLDDEIVEVAGRVYVKATATLSNSEGNQLTATAFAREPESKKGMDSAQLTGATSSYARKYALNGLFAIDDTKDADTKDNTFTKANAKEYAKQLYEFFNANDADGAKQIWSELSKDEKAAVWNALPHEERVSIGELLK